MSTAVKTITVKPDHEATVLKIRELKQGTASQIGAASSVIAKLVRDGVIETVATLKGGRGRPANVYSLTADGRRLAGNIARRVKR